MRTRVLLCVEMGSGALTRTFVYDLRITHLSLPPEPRAPREFASKPRTGPKP